MCILFILKTNADIIYGLTTLNIVIVLMLYYCIRLVDMMEVFVCMLEFFLCIDSGGHDLDLRPYIYFVLLI